MKDKPPPPSEEVGTLIERGFAITTERLIRICGLRKSRAIKLNAVVTIG